MFSDIAAVDDHVECISSTAPTINHPPTGMLRKHLSLLCHLTFSFATDLFQFRVSQTICLITLCAVQVRSMEYEYDRDGYYLAMNDCVHTWHLKPVKKCIDTNDKVASIIFQKVKTLLFCHILQVLVACRNMAAMLPTNVMDDDINKLCRCINLGFGFNPSSPPTPLPSQRYACTSPNLIAVCLVGKANFVGC